MGNSATVDSMPSVFCRILEERMVPSLSERVLPLLETTHCLLRESLVSLNFACWHAHTFHLQLYSKLLSLSLPLSHYVTVEIASIIIVVYIQSQRVVVQNIISLTRLALILSMISLNITRYICVYLSLSQLMSRVMIVAPGQQLTFCIHGTYILTNLWHFCNTPPPTHTQSNPLKSPAFEQILGFPVPQQNSHLGKPWFHEKLTRQQSEDMLKRVRMDGAFLIRHSDHKTHGRKNYAISFRYTSILTLLVL